MFNFFKKTLGRVKKSTGGFFRSLIPVSIDENSIKNVENIFYSADFGIEITAEIIGEMRTELKKNKEMRREDVVSVASKILEKNLNGAEASLEIPENSTQVICLVGANGSGKTTTAAKLAYFYEKLGKKTLLGSCDTFRAAADEQLRTWGKNLSIDVVASKHGADPAAVAFDAYKAAVARGKNVVILDTAGRLHVKSSLMGELQKILRILKKANNDITPNVWLVADATIGTNTIESTETFHSEIGLTGIVLAKLDGTSAGGALVGVYKKLHIPIYFIGTGETPESLEKFSATKYIDGLFASHT
jgi:fused signal recognition particle receptor